MEFLDGDTLDRHMSKVVQRRYAPRIDPFKFIGQMLAEIHAIRTEGLPAQKVPRLNETFKANFESIWCDIAFNRWLPVQYRDPEKLYEYISPSWNSRAPYCLLPRDIQPKNVILCTDGPKIIDTNYSFGNPAISSGIFLASLDRSHFLIRNKRQDRLIRIWKRSFLRSYLRCARNGEEVLEDLIFFYPWCLLQSYKLHIIKRRRFRSYLGFFYASQIRQFLRALDKHEKQSIITYIDN
jgi:hypothetical protein